VTDEDEVNRILADYSDPKESESRLWRDLADWAFAQEPKIPRDIPEDAIKRLLDDAAACVKGLNTVAGWSSAARYFQAENVHDLEGPAADRAVALMKRTRTKTKAKTKTKTKTSATTKAKTKTKANTK
jgi:hypothetical protein